MADNKVDNRYREVSPLPSTAAGAASTAKELKQAKKTKQVERTTLSLDDSLDNLPNSVSRQQRLGATLPPPELPVVNQLTAEQKQEVERFAENMAILGKNFPALCGSAAMDNMQNLWQALTLTAEPQVSLAVASQLKQATDTLRNIIQYLETVPGAGQLGEPTTAAELLSKLQAAAATLSKAKLSDYPALAAQGAEGAELATLQATARQLLQEIAAAGGTPLSMEAQIQLKATLSQLLTSAEGTSAANNSQALFTNPALSQTIAEFKQLPKDFKDPAQREALANVAEQLSQQLTKLGSSAYPALSASLAAQQVAALQELLKAFKKSLTKAAEQQVVDSKLAQELTSQAEDLQQVHSGASVANNVTVLNQAVKSPKMPSLGASAGGASAGGASGPTALKLKPLGASTDAVTKQPLDPALTTATGPTATSPLLKSFMQVATDFADALTLNMLFMKLGVKGDAKNLQDTQGLMDCLDKIKDFLTQAAVKEYQENSAKLQEAAAKSAEARRKSGALGIVSKVVTAVALVVAVALSVITAGATVGLAGALLLTLVCTGAGAGVGAGISKAIRGHVAEDDVLLGASIGAALPGLIFGIAGGASSAAAADAAEAGADGAVVGAQVGVNAANQAAQGALRAAVETVKQAIKELIKKLATILTKFSQWVNKISPKLEKLSLGLATRSTSAPDKLDKLARILVVSLEAINGGTKVGEAAINHTAKMAQLEAQAQEVSVKLVQLQQDINLETTKSVQRMQEDIGKVINNVLEQMISMLQQSMDTAHKWQTALAVLPSNV